MPTTAQTAIAVIGIDIGVAWPGRNTLCQCA